MHFFHSLHRGFGDYDGRGSERSSDDGYSSFRGGTRGGGSGGGDWGREPRFGWRDAEEIAKQERRFQMRGLRGQSIQGLVRFQDRILPLNHSVALFSRVHATLKDAMLVRW